MLMHSSDLNNTGDTGLSLGAAGPVKGPPSIDSERALYCYTVPSSGQDSKIVRPSWYRLVSDELNKTREKYNLL